MPLPPALATLAAVTAAIDRINQLLGLVEAGKRWTRRQVLDPVLTLAADTVAAQVRLAVLEQATLMAGSAIRTNALVVVSVIVAAFLADLLLPAGWTRLVISAVLIIASVLSLPAFLRSLALAVAALRAWLALGIDPHRLLRFVAYAGLLGRPELASPEVKRALWLARQVDGPGDAAALAWRLSDEIPTAIRATLAILAWHLLMPLLTLGLLLRMLLHY
ncbi:MAG: hypothetical protein OHK0024_05380 [Thalassobaculales bacterium]